MSIGFKTSTDGTLLTTLGKKLIKSVKIKAVDIRKPFLLSGQCKEVTFAIVPNTISFYVNDKKEDARLTIDDKCSIEAIINAAWIQAPASTPDDDEFEIWLWK